MIRILWPLCTCPAYILTLLQVSNHYLENYRSWADTNLTMPIVYKTNFLSKSRACNSDNNNLIIKVLWPLCTCSVYILIMVQVSNHYLVNCRRSCRGTNSTIKCEWRMVGGCTVTDRHMTDSEMTEGRTICPPPLHDGECKKSLIKGYGVNVDNN